MTAVEVSGFLPYIDAHKNELDNVVAGLCLDSVGQDFGICGGEFLLFQSPETNASFIDGPWNLSTLQLRMSLLRDFRPIIMLLSHGIRRDSGEMMPLCLTDSLIYQHLKYQLGPIDSITVLWIDPNR